VSRGAATARRLRHDLTESLRHRRLLFPALVSLRPRRKELLVTRRTDITIEGFPRSGNSFAVEAFRLANPDRHVAHHLHSPVQILRSVQYGIPCILLVRGPVDAVASALVQAPYKDPTRTLRDWTMFYERLVPVVDHVVVAPFERVVSDFGAVIERVNDAYNTEFVVYRNSSRADEHVLDVLARGHQQRNRGTIDEFRIARPSPARDARIREAKSLLAEANLASVREAAEALYRRLVDTRG
jgi:hypothetical protein